MSFSKGQYVMYNSKCCTYNKIVLLVFNLIFGYQLKENNNQDNIYLI